MFKAQIWLACSTFPVEIQIEKRVLIILLQNIWVRLSLWLIKGMNLMTNVAQWNSNYKLYIPYVSTGKSKAVIEFSKEGFGDQILRGH